MKTLYLIRHAKSSWNIEGLEDIDRHLNHRGYADAHEMGTRLKKDIRESYIVSSPAIRAISTALIFSRYLDHDPSRIHIEPKLYATGPHEYRDVIAKLPEDKHTILLFGHNPVITEVVNILCNTNMDEMPTCAIAGIQFGDVTWKKAAASTGKLALYDFPKNTVHQE